MTKRKHLRSFVLAFVTCVAFFSCRSPEPTDGDADDADIDQADTDAQSDTDEIDDPDSETENDADPDEDNDGPIVDTAPAEITQTGTSDLLLRGIVLTPTSILDPGEVFIVGSQIECVAENCSGHAGAAEATIIETNGIISPGLIDAHNHIAYNFLPEWTPDPPRTFDHRYEWADDPGYEAHIEPYSAHRSSNSHFCPAAKWGELRSLVHGTTTMQGQPSAQGSCINWGIRNTNRYHGLGYDHMQQYIGSVRDLNDADAASLIENFTATEEPTTRYHVHMAEGIAGNVLEEFESYAGRDPDDHYGTSLLDYGTTMLIHSIPLTNAQLDEVEDTGSMIVWSPSSNMVLYGTTAPIQEILNRDIVVGLGPDWTISGEDEMLSEMRFALNFGADEGVDGLTPQRLWEMSTFDGAEVVGLEDHIGQLAPGFQADIAVFGIDGPDPYEALLESRAHHVRLVLVDGQGFYGDANLEQVTARNDYCESFDACGTDKFICVQDSPSADRFRDQTYEDISTELYNILEGIGYPGEKYGRGDELLPIVDCSL